MITVVTFFVALMFYTSSDTTTVTKDTYRDQYQDHYQDQKLPQEIERTTMLEPKVAKRLADSFLSPCDCAKRTVDIKKENEDWKIVVVDNTLYDDSEKANRFFMTAALHNGQWLIKNLDKTEIQCWPGRGHQDFSDQPCL